LEKQLEELKQLQEANNKKLSMLEDDLKSKFIPDEDELYITEKIFKKNPSNEGDEKKEEITVSSRDTDDLVLPKLSEDTNVTKAENVKNPPSVKSNRSSGCRTPNNGAVKENKLTVDEQVDALISHFRRDGYGNNPWIGNKPTSFEYERMKKFPPSKATIKVRSLYIYIYYI